jgi:hypothetical protein
MFFLAKKLSDKGHLNDMQTGCQVREIKEERAAAPLHRASASCNIALVNRYCEQM